MVTKDLSHDQIILELKETTQREQISPQKSTPRSKSVVEVFAETLKNSNEKNMLQITPNKKIVKKRIKPESYGEVLTSKEKIKKEKQDKKKNKVKSKDQKKQQKPEIH